MNVSMALMVMLFAMGVEAAGGKAGKSLAPLMAVDFAEFHKLGRLCVVDLGHRSPWLVNALRALASARSAFVAVAPAEALMGVTSSANGTDARSHPAVPLGDLLVTQVGTEEQAETLAQVFSAQSTHMRWMVIMPASRMLGWLALMYFPLNNEVTVAAYRTGEGTISLWQVYQATPELKQRLLPSGLWTPRLRSRKDSETGSMKDSGTGSMKDSGTGSMKDSGTGSMKDSPSSRWERAKSEVLTARGEETISRDMTHGRLEMVEGDPLLRRRDLTGFHLRCTTLSAPPRMILEPLPGGGTVGVKGILGSVFQHLQEVTNFTSTCRPTRDGQWGGLKDGRWTGMVGDIVNDFADIAVASLDVTFQRGGAVDFLLPVVHTEYKMVVKRPTNDDRVWAAYTEEFEGEVWQVLFVLTPTLILALYLSSFVGVEERMSLSEAFTAVTGALCGQSTDIELKTAPSRLVFLVILQLQVLLQSYYTCVLVSSLALGPPLPTIASVADVQRHPGLELGFVRGSSITEYFKNSADPAYQRVWQSSADESLPASRQEAMARVLQDSYVFLDAVSYLRDNHGQDCRLAILPLAYFPSLSAFAVRKGSPLVPLFNHLILQMRSTGLLSRWERRFSPVLPDCSHVESEAIRLATVATPFLMLGMAMLSSLLCLLGERTIRRRWASEGMRKG